MTWDVVEGEAKAVLRSLPTGVAQVCVTSPPYWKLRDYGVKGQLGWEPTPEEFIRNLVEVLDEVGRVLRADGVLFVNIGDCYNTNHGGAGGQRGREKFPTYQKGTGRGRDPKLKLGDLVGIPWMLAFAMRSAGWYWRQTITWGKTAPMPESIDDRPSCATEPILLFAKNRDYYYDPDAIREPCSPDSHGGPNARPGRKNAHQGRQHSRLGKWTAEDKVKGRRLRNYWLVDDPDFWLLGPERYHGDHPAPFPTEIPRRCILLGSRPGDLVIDPFVGSGATGVAAVKTGRRFFGGDLKPSYCDEARQRISGAADQAVRATEQADVTWAPLQRGPAKGPLFETIGGIL